MTAILGSAMRGDKKRIEKCVDLPLFNRALSIHADLIIIDSGDGEILSYIAVRYKIHNNIDLR